MWRNISAKLIIFIFRLFHIWNNIIQMFHSILNIAIESWIYWFSLQIFLNLYFGCFSLYIIWYMGSLTKFVSYFFQVLNIMIFKFLSKLVYTLFYWINWIFILSMNKIFVKHFKNLQFLIFTNNFFYFRYHLH